MARKKTSAVKPRAQRKTAAPKPGQSGGRGADEAAFEHFLWTVGASSMEGYEDRILTESTALAYSAVWACVSIIADSLAMSGFHVYESQAKGKRKLEGDEEDVAWLLNTQPNPEQSAYDFRKVMHVDELLRGNGLAEIERDMMGRVKWLWHIKAERVTMARNDAGRIIYLVDNGNQRDPTVIAAENMLHWKGLSLDGYWGCTTIQMMRQSIQLGKSQEGYGETFFSRGPMPGGILEIPGNVKKEERDAVRDTFQKTYGGKKNAGRVVALAGGMKFQPTSLPNQDAQFIESREFQIEEICRWYRVPPSKLGVMSKTSYSSQVQAATEFVQFGLMPWAIQAEKEADIKLFGSINRGRKWTKMNLGVLMRGDPETQTKTLQGQVNTGLRTLNEAREELDLNPVTGGDETIVQGAMTTLELVIDPPEPPAPAQPPAAPGQDADEPTQEPDDMAQTDAKAEQVQRIFGNLFRETFARLMRVESDKAKRADGKDELKQHCDEFYGERYVGHIAANVRSIVDGFAVATGRDVGKGGTASQAIASEFDAEGRRSLAKDCGAAVDKTDWQERPGRMALRALAICTEVL